MRIATVCLSSCCGCHMALVNLGEDLLSLLGMHDLVFSPVLMDTKEPPECDIALVEGGVRNQENREMLERLRQSARTVVALGTCACFGGVPGLGSACSNESLLQEAYGKEPGPEVPALEPRVTPIDACVKVDVYLPGCPPPLAILGDTLKCLVEGRTPVRHDLPICAECPRTAVSGVTAELKRTLNEIPLPDVCLLSQGFVCLGSVSRAGCGAPCPTAGVPCLGCRGPTDRVFTDPSHGIIQDLVKRISHFTNHKPKDIAKRVEDQLHCLYAFTLSVPELRTKNAENIGAFVHRITLP